MAISICNIGITLTDTLMSEIRRLYMRVPRELYMELMEMADAGGYTSPHALVLDVLHHITHLRRAYRKESCPPDIATEIDDIFRGYTNAEAPVYGLGKRQEGHKEP